MAEQKRKVFEGQGELHIDDAAMRALMVLLNQPNVANQEYITLLMQPWREGSSDPRGGMHFRAPPQTLGLRDTSAFTGETYGNPTATVHTHPTQLPTDTAPQTYFSDVDAAQAQATQEPNYIGTQPLTGPPQYRKLNAPPPGQNVRTPEIQRQGMKGEEFLAQFPHDLFLDLISTGNPLRQALIADWHKAYEMGPPTRAEYYGGNSATR